MELVWLDYDYYRCILTRDLPNTENDQISQRYKLIFVQNLKNGL